MNHAKARWKNTSAVFSLFMIYSKSSARLEGMFGSRFMGGGFGGCVVGFLSRHPQAGSCSAANKSHQLHPEIAGSKQLFISPGQTMESGHDERGHPFALASPPGCIRSQGTFQTAAGKPASIIYWNRW